ncbi:MAG: DUF952 domain-containing protein [Balneolaceae bacterium]
MKHDLIFHLVSRQTWKDRIVNGAYQPESLTENIGKEAKIPCCNPDQVERVANNKFKGTENLYLIVIDVNRVSPRITTSEIDGQVYPQINGPLNMDAVIDKILLETDQEGLFEIEIDIH